MGALITVIVVVVLLGFGLLVRIVNQYEAGRAVPAGPAAGLASYTIVGGNPAKPLKKRYPDEDIDRLLRVA